MILEMMEWLALSDDTERSSEIQVELECWDLGRRKACSAWDSTFCDLQTSTALWIVVTIKKENEAVPETRLW